MQYRKSNRTFNLTPSDQSLADISETGARLLLDREMKVGNLATLEISSSKQKLTLKSKIVRSAPKAGGKFDTGLHYLDITAEQAKLLKAILDGHDRGVPLKAHLLS